MAAAATDTLAVGTMASDSIVMTMTTTAVVVEATETQPVRRQAQATRSASMSGVGGPTRGRLAGQMSRWQAGLGADTPATPCGSVARCDGRGRGLAAEVRAHAEDDVDFAMPVSGTTGGHVRAKQEQPVCRRREQRVACVRRRQRHRCRAAPSAESHKSSAERSN